MGRDKSRNKYEGDCWKCRARVRAGYGFRVNFGAGWETECEKCNAERKAKLAANT